MKTTEELIQALKEPKTKTLAVVGPYIGAYELITPEEAELFKLKGIARNAKQFYDVLTRKILTPCDELKAILSAFNSYVDKCYAQTINGSLGANISYLKGDASHLECTGCHKTYTLDSVPDNLECDCGRLIRPKCLLTSEQYNMEKIEAFEKELKTSDIVFLVGFDFNEIELCKQLEIIAAEKLSGGKGPTVIVVGECDGSSVYETFYPEFIVDERPESALKRLLEKMND